jgi:hypothetical protein
MKEREARSAREHAELEVERITENLKHIGDEETKAFEEKAYVDDDLAAAVCDVKFWRGAVDEIRKESAKGAGESLNAVRKKMHEMDLQYQMAEEVPFHILMKSVWNEVLLKNLQRGWRETQKELQRHHETVNDLSLLQIQLRNETRVFATRILCADCIEELVREWAQRESAPLRVATVSKPPRLPEFKPIELSRRAMTPDSEVTTRPSTHEGTIRERLRVTQPRANDERKIREYVRPDLRVGKDLKAEAEAEPITRIEAAREELKIGLRKPVLG